MHKFLSKAKTYRYPPPASAAQPRIPEGPAHRTYDITYYGRDTRRNEWEFTEEIENAFHPTTRNLIASHGLVEDASEKPGSAGNSNPDVMRYDPSGLRTSMTANHVAMRDALDAAMPTQLVRNEWEEDADEIIADYTSKGLPPVPGKPYSMKGKHPHLYRPRW